MNLSRLTLPATVLTTATLLLASPSGLAYQRDGGFYLGGAYGVADVDDSEFDDDDRVRQLFAGIQFNSFLGIEGSYMDFGNHGDSLRSDIDGYTLSGTGTLPLTETFSLYAKAGRLWWDTEVKSNGFRDSFNGNEWYYGMGMNFEITHSLRFRLNYDRVDIELEENEIGPVANADFDSQVDILSAGLRLQF